MCLFDGKADSCYDVNFDIISDGTGGCMASDTKSKLVQDCFIQKEARVCVTNAFVIEDSKF